MTICIQCNNEFEATRKTAKFCSHKCQLASHRNKVSVSNETVSETVNETVSETYKCKVCGVPFVDIDGNWTADATWEQKVEGAKLINTCYPCFHKGKEDKVSL